MKSFIKNIRLTIVIVACLSTLFCSCTEHPAFSEYKGVEVSGWDKNRPVHFSVPMTDTLSRFDILVDVRNDNSYPYQNFWMFINSISPSGIKQKDTIECFLADNTGKWLGKGFSSTREVSVLYFKGINFPEKGTYRFTIQQGMRSNLLQGIGGIGLTIKKSKR